MFFCYYFVPKVKMQIEKTKLLTKKEINNPHLVLSEFYNLYGIKQTRVLIKIFVNGRAVTKDREVLEKLKTWQTQLTRVLEASWLIEQGGQL